MSASNHSGWKRLIILVLVLMVGIGGGVVLEHFRPRGGGGAPEEEQLYTCPMHPQIIRHEPGECPICGMNLVPVKKESKPADSSAERKISFYRSPMDPKQTSPVPRKDEMGMDYVPVYEDELAGGGTGSEGLATVTIDPARQQIIGLTTAKAVRGPIGGSWRTVADLQVDERRVRKVNVKVEGYVERIFVDFTGQPVELGDPLFSLYSPEVLAAENEYLLALRARDTLSKSSYAAKDGDALAQSARKRLELWDVPPGEIHRIARTGRASKALTYYSPIAGVVTMKNVVQGSALKPGDVPYEITDLSQVWALADGYESDLRLVSVGMRATLTLAAYPSRAFDGLVEFIDPVLDPVSRTAKVRMTFANPAGELKPGLYGEVVLRGLPHDAVLIPVDAVISSGTRDVVFVSLGQGKFAPREVTLGLREQDQVEAQSGLTAGDEVVTRANFLIDSESSLRASLAAIGGN